MTKEELIEKYGPENKIKVLDGQGHVAFIDCMGDDEAVEAAARLSYQKGTRKVSETRGLLRYMLRHRHSTPFEAAVIKLDMKMPIFIARQLVRQRTQSISELSGRYSILPTEFYTPPLEQVCYQSTDNKQGRSGAFPANEAEQLQNQMAHEAEDAFATYNQFLEAGMAKETARMGLPLSTYTQWNTTMNLHNLLHMLSLRLDEHAQWEARQVAEAIWRITQDWCPLTAEAFNDYRLQAHTFSRLDLKALRTLVFDWREYVEAEAEGEGTDPAALVAERAGALSADLPKRERDEFLKVLGLTSTEKY